MRKMWQTRDKGFSAMDRQRRRHAMFEDLAPLVLHRYGDLNVVDRQYVLRLLAHKVAEQYQEHAANERLF